MNWNWSPKRSEGVWRHGLPSARVLVAAAPYLMVILLMVMLYFLADTLTFAKGVVINLPDSQVSDGEVAAMVALVMPFEHDTLVFFDDARYFLDDEDSAKALVDHFNERTVTEDDCSLLVLADQNVDGGELMRFASIAKLGGMKKILFAERRKMVQE